MNRQETENELIEAAELEITPPSAPVSTELECEIVNAIIDGCAEELRGIDPKKLDDWTRNRMERVLAAIKGTEIPSKLQLAMADREAREVEAHEEPIHVSRGAF